MRLASAAAVLFSFTAALAGFACDGDLDTGCRDGECTGSTSSGVGGGGGECAGVAHDLPCGVYDIFSNICQACHVPGGQGPFPLQEYCDTQDTYASMLIWQRMKQAIKVDAFPRMPLGGDPLPQADMDTLNAWFATCEAGTCEGANGLPGPACGEGGAGGAGGAPAGGGGAGGAPAGGGGAGGS